MNLSRYSGEQISFILKSYTEVLSENVSAYLNQSGITGTTSSTVLNPFEYILPS